MFKKYTIFHRDKFNKYTNLNTLPLNYSLTQFFIKFKEIFYFHHLKELLISNLIRPKFVQKIPPRANKYSIWKMDVKWKNKSNWNTYQRTDR